MSGEEWKLGQTSEHYETGGRGADTVSSGIDDPGGISYGSYQMTSQSPDKHGNVVLGGTVAKFLKSTKYGDEFRGLTPGSKDFGIKWKDVASRDQYFALAQHDYIKKTHYDKLVDNLKDKGIDLTDRGPAVQDALWSTSVQYGPGKTSIFMKGVENKFGNGYDFSRLSDEDIVAAVQDYKADHVKELFPRVRKQRTLDSLKGRAENEKEALLYLAEHGKARDQVGLERADAAIKSIQNSLTTLGYTDAQGRALLPDGNYGPNTRYAIESFQRQSGLEVDGLANQDTLCAIQQRTSVLNPLRDREQPSFDQALPGLPPELQARVLQKAGNGPERTIPGQALPVLQSTHHVGPMPSRGTSPPAAESVRLPPMPPVQQLQPGAQGAAVFVLQEHLRMLNAHDAEGRQIKPDRDYGPRTVQAVENFQMWVGLNPSGSADRTTLDALTAHAQYAQRQQAQGIPKSDHLADNLNPALSNPTRQVATQELDDQDREQQAQQAREQQHQWQIEQDQGRQLERQVRREENETREQPRSEDRRSGALLLFCDVQHPQHALYADVKERLEVRGHALPEDRLHQITAELHTAGFKAGWEGSLDVYNQAAYALDERNLWGGAAKVPLSEPVPPMHASVEAAHHHDQLQASMQAEFAQRQQMERYAPQQGPVLG